VYDAMPRATRAFKPQPGAGRRRGFTLVEVLVVIMIVGMLAGLLLPAVMQALARARTTAIKAEIDMLHMAIMNYKNEYGSFPPAFNRMPPRDWTPTNFGPPYSAYTGNSTKNGLHDRHITRIFPRCSMPVVKPTFPTAFSLNPFTAIHYWLSGYSNSPVTPTVGQLNLLYDFDRGRLELIPAGGIFTGRYHSANAASGGFYAYIDSSNYFFQMPSGQEFPTPLVEFDRRTATLPGAFGEDRNNNNTIDVASPFTEDANGNGVLDAGMPFNPDTFQILHPGRDGVFGTDDDLSNFWPGTRREYLDSLRN